MRVKRGLFLPLASVLLNESVLSLSDRPTDGHFRFTSEKKQERGKQNPNE